MADKSFGVRQLNLLGSSGTPTLTSPNNLNINAVNVAISTDLSVGGVVTVGSTITATRFVGDGSGLTGVVGSGSGVVIYDDTSLIGTAGTIVFGDNLTVSAISAGIATITGLTPSQWISTGSGIHTTSNVGVGTTNPTSAFTVKGNTSLETLSVSGVSTFTNNISLNSGHLKFASGFARIKVGDSDNIEIYHDGGEGAVIKGSSDLVLKQTRLIVNNAANTENMIVATQNGSVELYYDNSKEFETTGYGATVYGTLQSQGLNVSGVTTALSVGSSSFTLTTNNPTIVGTSGTAGQIKQIAGAPFWYDGSAWREFVLSSGTPVTQPADTEWDNVVFRATFDDDFTDAKFGATPVYVSAGSTIVGAAVTIGTGAFRNDGAVGSGVSYAYRSNYDFTGSWTIEFWMYVDSNPVNNSSLPVSLISMNSTTGIGTSGNWTLAMYGDGFANKYISWFNQNHPSYNNGTSLYYVAGSTWDSVILDKWNHFALVRESNNGSLHFYINGTEQSSTTPNTIIDNDILDINGNGLHFGGDTSFTIGSLTFNSNASPDVIFDDVRISAGVGTAGQRYTSIGISTYATFTPPTSQLPITGTLSSIVQPPGDKYGEIGLGTTPTWRGTSGVTVSQQSSGNYRVSFASTYTNANDYFVLTQAMDQGFASYVGVARSTTHVDFSINKQSDDTAVNTGSLSVQIKNHI